MLPIPFIVALMAGCRPSVYCKKSDVPEGFEDAVKTTDAGALVSHPIISDSPPVDVYVDQASFPANLDSGKVLQAIKNSFTTWENQLGSAIQFNVIEADSSLMKDDARYGGFNTVSFNDKWEDENCSNTCDRLAHAQTQADNFNGDVLEFDIEFNTRDYAWTIEDDPENNQGGTSLHQLHDIQNVMTHEVGHILGLTDIDCEDNDQQTMCGTSDAGETIKRNLSEEDRATLDAIYRECEVELASAGIY